MQLWYNMSLPDVKKASAHACFWVAIQLGSVWGNLSFILICSFTCTFPSSDCFGYTFWLNYTINLFKEQVSLCSKLYKIPLYDHNS